MVREGQIHTVTCGGWASDGAAVARVDGLAVFVKGALPGETCQIAIEHVGHSTAWARIVQLLDPSPARVTPDCPYYPLCGGCHLRHMTYEEELSFKRTRVEDALRRIGGLDCSLSVIHGAARIDGYRNKLQLPVAAGPVAGCYRGRSHQVVDLPQCRLQPPWGGTLRRALLDWMRQYQVPAYDETTRTGLIRHLFLRGSQQGECLCALVSAQPTLPREDALVRALRQAEPGLVGVLVNHNDKATNVVLGETSRLLWGRDYLDDTLRGLTFRLSVPSFYQINHDQTEVLYGLVRDYAALTGRETVLDLYCGAGTIGLTLAGEARSLLGVEIVPDAIEDARRNAERNGIQNARFLCSDAAHLAPRLAREGTPADLVIVDPPRKGLAPPVTDALLAIGSPRLIYVSCDPATLARDLKRLSPAYRLRRLEAVDLFPRTYHVETAVLLERA